jgi:hypothetical protein
VTLQVVSSMDAARRVAEVWRAPEDGWRVDPCCALKEHWFREGGAVSWCGAVGAHAVHSYEGGAGHYMAALPEPSEAAGEPGGPGRCPHCLEGVTARQEGRRPAKWARAASSYRAGV